MVVLVVRRGHWLDSSSERWTFSDLTQRWFLISGWLWILNFPTPELSVVIDGEPSARRVGGVVCSVPLHFLLLIDNLLFCVPFALGESVHHFDTRRNNFFLTCSGSSCSRLLPSDELTTDEGCGSDCGTAFWLAGGERGSQDGMKMKKLAGLGRYLSYCTSGCTRGRVEMRFKLGLLWRESYFFFTMFLPFLQRKQEVKGKNVFFSPPATLKWMKPSRFLSDKMFSDLVLSLNW